MSVNTNLEQPLNANERFLYGINIRLDAIIDMLSSFIDTYAKQNGLATITNEIKEEVVKVPRKTTKK